MNARKLGTICALLAATPNLIGCESLLVRARALRQGGYHFPNFPAVPRQPIVAATPGGRDAAAPRLISAPLSRELEGPQQSIDQLHNNKALELFVSCTTLSRRAVLRAVPRAPTIENPV